jgi:RimJ/RimL family protein N-acetyltransferase
LIETKRLTFRKYTVKDIDLLLQMTKDPEVMRYIGNGTPWMKDESQQKLEKFIKRYTTDEGLGLMAAIRKQDGEFVGHAGLVPQMIEGNHETEIGYWIARKYWGMGYALESARRWRDYGFNKSKKTRLISLIQYGNIGSIRVAEKNGLKFDREVLWNHRKIAMYSIQRN